MLHVISAKETSKASQSKTTPRPRAMREPDSAGSKSFQEDAASVCLLNDEPFVKNVISESIHVLNNMGLP